MTSPNRKPCVLCGRARARHYDERNVWIGCMGARRDEQPFEPRAPEPQQAPGPLDVPTRAQHLWQRILNRWRN